MKTKIRPINGIVTVQETKLSAFDLARNTQAKRTQGQITDPYNQSLS